MINVRRKCIVRRESQRRIILDVCCFTMLLLFIQQLSLIRAMQSSVENRRFKLHEMTCLHIYANCLYKILTNFANNPRVLVFWQLYIQFILKSTTLHCLALSMFLINHAWSTINPLHDQPLHRSFYLHILQIPAWLYTMHQLHFPTPTIAHKFLSCYI